MRDGGAQRAARQIVDAADDISTAPDKAINRLIRRSDSAPYRGTGRSLTREVSHDAAT